MKGARPDGFNLGTGVGVANQGDVVFKREKKKKNLLAPRLTDFT